jgi:hypothetical protein
MLYAALPPESATHIVSRGDPSLRTKSALGPDSDALNVDGYALLSKENLPAIVKQRCERGRAHHAHI